MPVPPRDYGGTELVVHELVEGLLDRGHDVTLFATGDSRTRAPLRSLYPRAQWPPEAPTDLNHVSWAMRQVAEGEYDVIHAHSTTALALPLFLQKFSFPVSLLQCRADAVLEFTQTFGDSVFCHPMSFGF